MEVIKLLNFIIHGFCKYFCFIDSFLLHLKSGHSIISWNSSQIFCFWHNTHNLLFFSMFCNLPHSIGSLWLLVRNLKKSNKYLLSRISNSNCCMDFNCSSSLKQQSADQHVAPTQTQYHDFETTSLLFYLVVRKLMSINKKKPEQIAKKK